MGEVTRLSHRLLLLCSLGLTLASAACTVIFDKQPEQCETSADCADLGADFAGTVCNADKVCVAPPKCASNLECSEKLGSVPAVCRGDGVCSELLSEECQRLVGAWDNPDAIVLGMLSDTSGYLSHAGVPMQNSIELAYQEFAKFGVGLPGGTNGRPRPLVVVGCNEAQNAQRAAEHLISDVSVPAIVGPSSSDTLLVLAKNLTIPAGVLLLSPSATSPAITDLADSDLVWRTAPSDAIQAKPLSLLVSHFEQEVRVELGLDASDPIRVAVLVKDDAFGTGLADAVSSQLVFNGKGPAENGDDYFQRAYADPAAGGFDAALVASEIAQFSPHVLMVLGTQESIEILAALEQALGAQPFKPRYVLTGWSRAAEMLALIGADDNLRKRVLGTIPGRRNTNFDSFALRYKAIYGSVPQTFGASNAYDAAYVLAYALAAVGDGELTGSSIAAGLQSTVGGDPLDVGPNPINAAIAKLTQGTRIDFNGASGALDFDLVSGEAKADIDIWCIVRNAENKPVFESSGQYFDAASETLQGSFGCL